MDEQQIPAKNSRLAVFSFRWVLASNLLFLIVSGLATYTPMGMDDPFATVWFISVFLLFYTGLIGIILAIIALVFIFRSKGSLGGKRYAFWAIVIDIFINGIMIAISNKIAQF